jgi:hypothetical protein
LNLEFGIARASTLDRSVAVTYFFDRRLGMAEMNWPNGPDPFQYREHRNEIDYGMVDFSGRSLGQSFYKPFLVTEAVRERITIA